MTSKEAFERIKKSHYIAMSCMGIDKPDIKTENAINTIEKDLDRLEELEKENKILKKDLKDYQAYIKKGVEEHYKYFMQDYDVLLEEYEELMKANEKLKKDLEVLEILKKYLYYDNKNHCIKMKYIYKRTTSFDYEDLKEWLEK